MDRSNSSKIKAVILDYGEVLCYPPTAEEMGRMAALFGMEPVPFRKLWDREPAALRPRRSFSRGLLGLGGKGCRHAARRRSNSPNSANGTLKCGRTTIPTMVQWLRQIHSSGVKTGLLSNMPHEMIRYVRQKFAWLDQFDHLTFSAEVSLIKPDAAIYEHSLRGVGVAAVRSAFCG